MEESLLVYAHLCFLEEEVRCGEAVGVLLWVLVGSAVVKDIASDWSEGLFLELRDKVMQARFG